MRPTGQELLRQIAYLQSEKGLKRPEIAKELGYGPKNLEKYITLANKEREARIEVQRAQDAALFGVDIGKPWQLEGDWTICGDIHVPCTDYALACRMAELAYETLPPPRKLLIAGDFFNFEAWSRFPAVITPYAWKQEREAARALIKQWRETFQEIRIISGNHDWRRIVAQDAVEDAEDLLDLLKSDGCQWSIYKWCTLESGGKRWRVTHPRNYSIVNLSVVERLAQKYDTNVIVFHEHKFSCSFDRYGRYLIVNGGCLVDSQKLAYVQLEDNTSGAMVKGFVMVRNGYPYLYGDERFTDWKN